MMVIGSAALIAVAVKIARFQNKLDVAQAQENRTKIMNINHLPTPSK
ncbi:MAG: hypothetical protein ABH832_02530 [bacterium]